MSHLTVTVKFRGKRAQAEWLAQLETFCRALVAERVASDVRVQAVFPGDRDAKMAALFTVDLWGARRDMAQRFQGLRGLEYAELAAPRRALG
jgi:hypothetical protein